MTAPSRTAAWFRRALLVAGLTAAGWLLWHLDIHAVGEWIGHVGWRLIVLLTIEILPELLHTTGWRLAFTPEASKSYGTGELLRLWVTGEGVNYLVPTATIAGEVARVSLLNDSHPTDVRAASVVIARINGTIGQIAFLLTGFALVLPSLPVMREHSWIGWTARTLLIILVAAVVAYAVIAWRWISADVTGTVETMRLRWLRAMPGHLRRYYGSHPARAVGSAVSFAGAYAWGAVEAFLICNFIGVPISPHTAVAIEVLSVTIDGVFFLVPAKVGTQELGKTAIFSMLGLPLTAGFAFGIIRHIRELAWALAGLGIYTAAGRRSPAPNSL